MTHTYLPEPTIKTPKGTRVSTTVLVGYIPYKYRPIECKTWSMDPNHPQKHWSSGCKHEDRRCDGHLVRVEGIYHGTTYYMDNSIEGVVIFDDAVDGKTQQVIQFKAPSGDVCF